MRIQNPLLICEWNARDFCVLVLLSSLALLGVVAVDEAGLRIGVLRSTISVGYLLLVPGSCILRLLKIHRLGSVTSLLFCVGLSLSAVMFLVAAYDGVSVVLGVTRPFSLVPLVLLILGCIGAIALLSLLVPCEPLETPKVDITFPSPALLLLVLLILLGILGPLVTNATGNTVVSLTAILVIVLVVALASIHDTVFSQLYPATIFAIALSLVYSAALMTNHLVEWADGWFEYSVSTGVVNQGVWIPSTRSDLNGVLSLTTLAPMISIVSGMEIAWVFKLVFPIILALIPVALYRLLCGYFAPRIAFLSAFAFVSFFSYFTDMLGLNRQLIAELFLVLTVLAFASQQLSRVLASLLGTIFAISLAVSHYALSYIFMISLAIAFLLVVARRIVGFIALSRRVKQPPGLQTQNERARLQARIVSPRFLLLYGTITIGWYIYISGSSSFVTLIRIADQIQTSILSDFLNPASTQGLQLVLATPSTPLNYVYKAVHLVWQGMIILGIASRLGRNSKQALGFDFLHLSIAYFALDVAGIVVPFFAATINTQRLFSVTLIFLAPFGILGGLVIVRFVERLLRLSNSSSLRAAGRAVTTFLLVYFLFNVGVIHHFANQPSSFVLDPKSGYRPHFTDSDILGAIWARDHIPPQKALYADAEYAYVLAGYRGLFLPLSGKGEIVNPVRNGDLLFLGTDNLELGTLRLENPELPRLNSTNVAIGNLAISFVLLNSSCIYDNANVQIFLIES